GRWCGRRAARAASATIRCSFPTAIRAPSGRWTPTRSTACRPAAEACRTGRAPSSSWRRPALRDADADRPAFGLYIHWPFCLRKCPACDSNSPGRRGAIDEARFVRAFAAEIATTAARVPGRTIATIFFGGGTPSLMAPSTVGAILDAAARHWTVPADVEVTLEANPTSVEATRFAGYRAAGVNRVSLGVQALDDAALAALGRLHSVREALDAVAIARATFARYSFDLIYARPGQTPAAWRAELERAIGEAAEH